VIHFFRKQFPFCLSLHKNEDVVLPNSLILAGEIVNYSDLHANIQDIFNAYGVQIMTPDYTGDTERAKLVPREGWYAPPAAPPPENGLKR
jgi:hypothetical protein